MLPRWNERSSGAEPSAKGVDNIWASKYSLAAGACSLTPEANTARPAGVTALSLFFVFGATMSGLTALMLLFPGSALEPLWRLNPKAHAGFASMGPWAVLLMTAVCAACATAAMGLRRRARFGYWTALAILVINLAGDTVNAVAGHDWRTLIGLPIGGLMIAYLVSQRRIFSY